MTERPDRPDLPEQTSSDPEKPDEGPSALGRRGFLVGSALGVGALGLLGCGDNECSDTGMPPVDAVQISCSSPSWTMNRDCMQSTTPSMKIWFELDSPVCRNE